MPATGSTTASAPETPTSVSRIKSGGERPLSGSMLAGLPSFKRVKTTSPSSTGPSLPQAPGENPKARKPLNSLVLKKQQDSDAIPCMTMLTRLYQPQ